MMVKKPEPSYVFEVPWHAEVFALAVHLSEKGHFGWTEWTSRLGKNLRYTKQNERTKFKENQIISNCNDSILDNSVKHGLNGSGDYYQVWLQTLIELMLDKGICDTESLNSLKEQWAEAYVQTPHGEPVNL